jgi:hypothetical protein
MGLMLICALFFGYIAITVKEHKDQWDREQEVIERLEEIKARRIVVESLKPKWLQFLLPEAYDKYFERVTMVMVANGPHFSEADLGRLKTLSHLQDLRIARYPVIQRQDSRIVFGRLPVPQRQGLRIVQDQAIQPTPPGVTDERLETFFKEMPAVYATAEQRMLSFLSETPTRPKGTYIGVSRMTCLPIDVVEHLSRVHNVEFIRLNDELERTDMLVDYELCSSLTDNLDRHLGKKLDYRIAPPWLWLIKRPSTTQASDAATGDSSIASRGSPPFTKEQAIGRLQELRACSKSTSGSLGNPS